MSKQETDITILSEWEMHNDTLSFNTPEHGARKVAFDFGEKGTFKAFREYYSMARTERRREFPFKLGLRLGEEKATLVMVTDLARSKIMIPFLKALEMHNIPTGQSVATMS